jgi:hypothetical protein
MTASARPLPTLPAPTSTSAAISRILTVAASQIGYREGLSGSSWNNDTIYGAWYPMNYNSWCAMFVSWCADKAAYGAKKYLDTIIPKHAYTPSGWNWFLSKGRAVTTPARGDIFYVYGLIGGVKRVHHVGFVEKVLPDGYIQTIEGNTNTTGSSQGNGVYRLKRRVTGSLRFARPNYAAVVVPPPAPTAFKWPAVPKLTTLSLKTLQAAADDNARISLSSNYHAQRVNAMSTLKRIGLAKTVYPTDPAKFAAHFRAAWAGYQRACGYRGSDADGHPGQDSFNRFCKRYGYRIVK